MRPKNSTENIVKTVQICTVLVCTDSVRILNLLHVLNLLSVLFLVQKGPLGMDGSGSGNTF